WMEFYDAPLMNHDAYLHRNSMLSIIIEHKNDMNVPIQHQFDVIAITKMQPVPPHLTSARKKLVQMGHVEMGRVSWIFSAQHIFQCQCPPSNTFFLLVAAARIIPNNCETLFRACGSRREMMTFCCGKTDIDGVCCCGGKIHNEEK
ncbi:hypothetical protein C8J56DRAFT_739887, partial [Mycena floridula]